MLGKADMSRKAVPCQSADVIEDFVDVDRRSFERRLAGKHLHPVDEGPDALRLVADKSRQPAILRADQLFHKLRPDATGVHRVLYPRRQHPRHLRYDTPPPAGNPTTY